MVRVGIGVISLVLAGCSTDAPAPSNVEEQLNRIEARLDRIDERLRSQEHAAIPAHTVTVDLPKANPNPTLSRIAVTISPTLLSIDGEPVASVALRAQLEELAATSPEASVVIHADAGVGHGRVVDVMDTIKEAGFSHIAIARRSED